MNLILYRKKTFKLFFFLIFIIVFTSKAFSQDTAAVAPRVVSGKILDDKGQPAVGAVVATKDGSSGASTGEDGSFQFETELNPPFTLVVTYSGFNTQEIEYTGPETNLNISLKSSTPTTPTTVLPTTSGTDSTAAVATDEVAVTARRRKETAQEVPIPISVVSGDKVAESGAFNVNRVKELVPTVQLYSSNPRNTTLNIRGLGSTFGLTNDGIDPGVGFYIDGVYFARPAATALDFVDIEQIEVLRGPQGTLFGKNTTAGAFNITTRKASFKPGASFELSYGNYGYIQAKTSVTGPLVKDKLAIRLSFSGTQRDGVIRNVRTGQDINDINNLGGRGQLLFTPSKKVSITLIGDATQQRPNGYAQVVAGVAPTMRPAYRQFEQIIKDLNYDLPSRNPFDRLVDHDTPWRSGNDLGGVSLNVDAKVFGGTLTSTSAWRYWNWDPSNDRDFTGLSVLRLSQATSKHQNCSQEIRYAGNVTEKISGVVGVFALGQDLKSDPEHIEESGSAQWRFSQSTPSAKWQTAGLFEGFGIKTRSRLQTLSAAAFANVDWEVLRGLHIQPGVRFNYDQKEVNFDRQTYGGLQTPDPELIGFKNSVYTNQKFDAKVDDNNWSGGITVAYKANKNLNAYATYSTNFKTVGINLGGLPVSGGKPMLELATIKPEYVKHIEFGVKTKPTSRSTLNVTFFNTDVEDYQTNVQSADPGTSRGYLANAEQIRVRGAELDASYRINKNFSFTGAFAYTDGIYVSFTNAPVPLEETGGPKQFKDVSGSDLPGISKYAGSLGADISTTGGKLIGQEGRYYIAFDTYYRSDFSSSPSPSKYLNVEGYALLNARIGFRATQGVSVTVWSRNLLDQNYFEQLLPASGNAGHYAGVLGDPRTYGITLRYSL